jgi:hypothetical protein
MKFKAWEYWPTYMFYLPNIPYAAYLALRAKSLVFFSATNPSIKHSGNGSESKYATIELIPAAFKPISLFIKANDPIPNTLENLHKKNIQFPLIIKPDIGFRGLLVKRIKTEIELIDYLTKHQNLNLIIQEFIDYKNECGIFYHRLPNEPKGKITSITIKKYLTITGDGNTTLKELILKDKRALLYLPLLTELHQQNFGLVLKNGEEFILNIIGNHSKGTQFINGDYLINQALETAIDSIMQQIPDFFYGRLDIKYNSFDELKRLQNFKIIELNGIISEPTHIYDPSKTTYMKALKEIRNHWKLIYKIATFNHKVNNVKYDKISDFLSSLNQLKKYTALIKNKT